MLSYKLEKHYLSVLACCKLVRIRFFFMAHQPLVGKGLLIIVASQSHSDTPHSVGLLWTSDQPVIENSDITQHSKQRDIHGPVEVRTRNPNKRVATDPLVGPRDRLCT